ncbi:MAG: chondroitin 4-sulfotransferase 11 [Candidatus Paceibacteria bacterium]|jgi:chondroitin 4-sulfotransferase 11
MKKRNNPIVRIIRSLMIRLYHDNFSLTNFIIENKKKLVYIVVPKTGCSSIKESFADSLDSVGEDRTHKQVSRKLNRPFLTRKQKKDFFKFTFVRNPFDRIASCYIHKIEKSKIALRRNYYGFATIEKDETFESFVKKIAKIPDFFSDQHFQSQQDILFLRRKPLYDYLGHYENLAGDFKRIQESFDLLSLPHIHDTQKGDWRCFYTKELAGIVYKRYKKDFEMLGYEGEYKKLMAYLEKKKPS